MRQIAHRSFHLNNRLLGWGIVRDGWGTWWWLYSVCVSGLIWSMLQQSESLVACSARCRAVRYASGLWQPVVAGGRPGENEITASVQSGRGALIIGREYEVDLENDPTWLTLMLVFTRLMGAEMYLILTSLSWIPDKLPNRLFKREGWSVHYL